MCESLSGRSDAFILTSGVAIATEDIAIINIGICHCCRNCRIQSHCLIRKTPIDPMDESLRKCESFMRKVSKVV